LLWPDKLHYRNEAERAINDPITLSSRDRTFSPITLSPRDSLRDVAQNFQVSIDEAVQIEGKTLGHLNLEVHAGDANLDSTCPVEVSVLSFKWACMYSPSSGHVESRLESLKFTSNPLMKDHCAQSLKDKIARLFEDVSITQGKALSLEVLKVLGAEFAGKYVDRFLEDAKEVNLFLSSVSLVHSSGKIQWKF
jgi:hypothetical protein